VHWAYKFLGYDENDIVIFGLEHVVLSVAGNSLNGHAKILVCPPPGKPG